MGERAQAARREDRPKADTPAVRLTFAEGARPLGEKLREHLLSLREREPGIVKS